MPIYEFECKKCKEVFEAMCAVADGASVSCPACGSGQSKKLVSVFGISKGGLKLGTLSPTEKVRAEAAFRRVERGRCCDTVCDPPDSD